MINLEGKFHFMGLSILLYFCIVSLQGPSSMGSAGLSERHRNALGHPELARVEAGCHLAYHSISYLDDDDGGDDDDLVGQLSGHHLLGHILEQLLLLLLLLLLVLRLLLE